MELKIHLEITNSQRFHHFCCLSSDLVSAGQSSRVLTAVLESAVVIVEGVTSLLIDKGGKKNLSRGTAFISMTAGTLIQS